jgi:hypothetical protein
MKPLFPLLITALLSLPAQAGPFAKGDPKIGQELLEEKCMNCHDNSIYLSKDRKVKTAEQLAARISMCNAMVDAGWFPEDEAHVGAYLNKEFYKFK